MKTIKKALALVVALCVMVSLVSISAFAADYTPTYSYDRFFYGSTGTGFLKTKVDYNNDGVKEDYYVAYGSDGYYTSIDGINWDKRTEIASLHSLAYGNDMGIGVPADNYAKPAYIFKKDFTSAGEVYNKLAGDNEIWIELHPNIYFDEFSGYFFCHGLEYLTTAPNSCTDVGLYYTDGTITSKTYGDKTVDALTWYEVKGDVFDSTNGFTASNITSYPIYLKGDDLGNILVTFHGNINKNPTQTGAEANLKQTFSYITTTIDANTGDKTVSGSYYTTTLTKFTPGIMYDGGEKVLTIGTVTSKGTCYYIWNKSNKTGTRSNFIPNGLTQTDFGITNVYEDNGTIYMVKDLKNIYKASFDSTTGRFTTPETVEVEGEKAIKSVTSGLFASHSYKDTTVQNGTQTTDNSTAYTVKDMLFLNDESIVLMVNATGGTKSKTYLYRLVTNESGVTTATQLHADTTYNRFTDTKSDTTARGYRVDSNIRAERIKGDAITEDTDAKDAANVFMATLSGEGSEYFTGDKTPYTTVSKDAPAGRYTINYFLTMNNQPSIFAIRTAVYDVVPRFKTTVNSGEAADEAYTAQLTAGENTVTVTLDDLERYVQSSSSNYDDTLESKFLVMAARYNSSHQMQEVVEIYDTAKLIAGSATPYTFNVTNAADGDYMKVFILEGFSTLKPLW